MENMNFYEFMETFIPQKGDSVQYRGFLKEIEPSERGFNYMTLITRSGERRIPFPTTSNKKNSLGKLVEIKLDSSEEFPHAHFREVKHQDN